MLNANFINLQKRSGLNNKELADYLKCDRVTVCKYRDGSSAVPMDAVKKINKLVQYVERGF